jgi:hypothetical protein
MKRRLTRVLLFTALALATVYAVDDLALRLRRQPFGSVTVQRYYALHKSKQKTNFMFAEPEAQVCVHSLLPHSGFTPCWYLSRHPEQRIDYE